jgi:ATP:ADP antiporter, AAA family
VFTVLRRATNFAIMNPTMEVLFTVVSREDKYKAKNVIETFVYRGGDQLSAWALGGLAALGLGLAGMSWVAVPVSAVWVALGVWLGRQQHQREGRRDQDRELDRELGRELEREKGREPAWGA